MAWLVAWTKPFTSRSAVVGRWPGRNPSHLEAPWWAGGAAARDGGLLWPMTRREAGGRLGAMVGAIYGGPLAPYGT